MSLAEVDNFTQVSNMELHLNTLNYVQGKDGVPRIADTCNAQDEYFNKFSIDSIPIDTRSCPSCLKCPCNYSRVSSQEQLESDYLKNNIEFIDGKFYCKYLYRSDLSK